MRNELLVLSSLLSVACGAGAASAHTARTDDGRYEVHLTRHVAVGRAWNDVAHFAGAQRMTVQLDGGPVEETTTTTTIDFDGDYTVLENDARGQPSRLRVVIQSLSVDSGQGTATPAVPGVLLIERGSPGTITSESGEALDPALAELLGNIMPVRERRSDDDLVFGTREPQAVGASWPLDAASAAGAFDDLSLPVDPANVSGSTLLASASTEAGIDCLTLRTTISASHVAFPNLEAGAVQRRGDVQATGELLLPLDVSLPALRDIARAEIHFEVEITTPAGPGVMDLTMQLEETHHRTLR